MNPKLQQEAQAVLGALRRAQHVFGADSAPAAPPVFAAGRDIQDNLGRGYF